MIKKYKEFIFEDYNDENSYYDANSYSDDSGFKSRFEKFKEYLSKKAAGLTGFQGSSSPSSASTYSQPVSTGKFTGDMKKMIELVINSLNKYGITNPLTQRAILSTIAKESGFKIDRSETSYKNTSASRIRSVFGSRFAGMSDPEIDALKKNDKEFWEKVYGGEWGRRELGNTQPGDGAKFIGRGFNGLTGRANYQSYSDLLRRNGTNADLVANPDLLYKPEIAAEANALYFLRGLTHPLIVKKYGNKDPNDFRDFITALKATVNANAGAGRDISRGFAKQSYDSAVAASNRYDFDSPTARTA